MNKSNMKKLERLPDSLTMIEALNQSMLDCILSDMNHKEAFIALCTEWYENKLNYGNKSNKC